VIGLVALTIVGAAVGAGGMKIRFTSADQAAARAAVLRRSDLPSASNWTVIPTKPVLSTGPTCSYYHPRVSDLVLTGASKTAFESASQGLGVASEAHVLQTARMVRLDWERTTTPAAVACLRNYLLKLAPAGSPAHLRFTRIAFPHFATYTAAFQMLADALVGAKRVPVTMQAVALSQGRTEITLITLGAAQASVPAVTVRLARILVARARA
jgi:hypothetical protein